jgi:hypothetical protein
VPIFKNEIQGELCPKWRADLMHLHFVQNVFEEFFYRVANLILNVLGQILFLIHRKGML